jgi:hypothetical protein
MSDGLRPFAPAIGANEISAAVSALMPGGRFRLRTTKENSNG